MDAAKTDDVLSQREVETIIAGFLKGRGKRGASEAEMYAVVRRVSELRMDGDLADLICTGEVTVVDWDGNDIVMDVPPDGEEQPV